MEACGRRQQLTADRVFPNNIKATSDGGLFLAFSNSSNCPVRLFSGRFFTCQNSPIRVGGYYRDVDVMNIPKKCRFSIGVLTPPEGLITAGRELPPDWSIREPKDGGTVDYSLWAGTTSIAKSSKRPFGV